MQIKMIQDPGLCHQKIPDPNKISIKKITTNLIWISE